MNNYLGNRESYRLSKEQILKFELEILPLLNDKTPNYKLLSEIITFHTKSSTSQKFIEYYKNKNGSKSTNDILNYLRVTKKRLIEYLEKYDYSLDKNYNLYKVCTLTLTQMAEQFYDFFKDIEIKDMKIFDTYLIEKDKHKLFNEKYTRMIKNTLSLGGSVSLLSVFESDETKNFCKDLLLLNSEVNNNLIIKYIPEPSHHSSSLIYILITDTKGLRYISYYENITNWSLVTLVDNDINFTEQFYDLLETRFNYFFNAKDKLENINKVIEVDKSLFNYGVNNENNGLM